MKNIYFTLVAFLFLAVANAQIVNIPDANFRTYLNLTYLVQFNSNGDIQNPDVLGTITILDVSYRSITTLEGIESLTNLQYLNCTSNQLTSLNIQELTNLQQLYCSYNQLSSLNLQGLINLQIFNCEYNQLNSLNVQGLTNLQSLYCGNNQLPMINVQGLTNLQQLDCSHNQLPMINVQGLTNLISLGCSYNQLPTINVQGLTNLISLGCSYNQLPTINVQGLTNLQYLSCDNNQLPMINVQGLTNLQQLICSHNQLSSLNVSGLINLTHMNCSNNQLSSLDVNGLTGLVFLNCSNNQLQFLYLKNTTFDFFGLDFGDNLYISYICCDDEDLALIQYKVYGYGYTSYCNVNSYCSFTPGGVFYTIQGNNKLDGNYNGCDALDSAYPNLKFNITNGTVSGSLISNNSGSYSIPVQAGSHTITPQFENPTYFTPSPTSVSVVFPATTSPFTQNFCIAPNGVHHDLEVVLIPIGVARPGFDATYKIKYKNKGTVSENATLIFNYNDTILDYVTSSVPPNSQTTGTLSWNIGTITPFQSGEILVTLNLNSPTETPAVNNGDILSYTTTIAGLNTDETIDDNTFALSQVVVNSFDPNDKTCLEGSIINPTMIGKYVHYKIRFENTGTFAAQNIVVKDMIDTTKFDLSTLQMTDASHSCITRISNPNKVEFIFENINLPFDDATNDGYVVFKIKTKSTLVAGNSISNSANIYFDYNFPIVTNTATSTFQVLQNDIFEFDSFFSIFPNPVKETLNLTTKQDTEIYSITIYNVLGQQVQSILNPINTINVSSIKTGSYFIKIVTDKGVSKSKFLKE